MKLVAIFLVGSLNVALSQGELPRILSGPTNREIARGSSLTFLCTTVGTPTPTVTWYKNGQPLVFSSRIKKLQDNSLYFEKVRKSSRRSDEGIYWCVAKNANGEARSRNATITVLYISRRFKINPKSTTASLLDFIQLDCRPPDAYPTPTIMWKKNSETVRVNDRIRTDSFGLVHHLRISKALQQDTGNYTCMATNRAGTRSSSIAEINVLVPPSVSVPQSKISVYEQDRVDLSCRTTGVPTPSVKWYKKEGELPLSKRLRYLSPSKIQITTARLDDAGVFICRAVNSQGITEVNVTLVVKMLPKFIERPGNLKVGIGQTARFECKVQAEPGYQIMWQRVNGPQVSLLARGQTESRVTIYKDGTLVIRNVQKNDEAAYVCTVISSNEKTESALARLTVVQSTVPLPEITLIPLNQRVVEGSDFNLTCIAKGTPTPTVSWQTASSNYTITKETEGVVIHNQGIVHSMILKAVRTSDSGSYRCIASNSDRIVSKVAYLTVLPVLKVPEPPNYVDYSNVTATSLVLKWKASRNPPGAPVTSYIVSIYDESGRVWKGLASNIKQLQYTVRNLKPASQYEFRVSAVNKVGRSNPSRSTKVIVTKPGKVARTTTPPASNPTPKFVDKLLNVSLTVTASSSSQIDWFNIFWTPVYPASRVKEFEIYWKKKSAMKFNRPIIVLGGSSNSYVLKGLEPGTPYEVKIRALNNWYGSKFSNVKSFSTMTKQEVFIPPPSNVRVKVNDTGKVLVTWAPSSLRRLSGYEIVWIALDGTSVETKTVPANATSYLITGLNPSKAYHVTLALKVDNRAGLKSDKLQITPALANNNANKNGGKSGSGTGTDGAADKRSNAGPGVTNNNNNDSRVVKLLKTPWFIGAVGGFLWVVLCIIILVIVLRRRKRKRSAPPFHAEQANGLLPTRSPVNSINRSRASYRDSSFLWGDADVTPVVSNGAPPSFKNLGAASASIPSYRNPSITEEDPGRSDIKPLL
eukprot:gene10863-12018_t